MVSHAHMTAMLAQSMGGTNHPALPTAHERHALSNQAVSENYLVVDASLFWDAVDQYEGDCKWSAFCTTIATAILLPTTDWNPLTLSDAAPRVAVDLHRSIALTPATPPPRTRL
jgi:hypothetical protein